MRNYPAVFLALVSTAVLSTSAMGAAGVVESQDYVIPGQGSAGGLATAVAGQAASNDALVMLLDQFRDMRGELQTLRALVEEQAYEINRLQRDSMDRYTDLDSRISQLYQDGPAASGSASSGVTPVSPVAPGASNSAGSAPVNTTPLSDFSQPPQSAPSGSTAGGALAQTRLPNTSVVEPNISSTLEPAMEPVLQPSLMTEQQLYQVALDSLLQDEQYQRSINQFDQYLAHYPDGRFVTNAYYWKGQAYVNLSMFAEARDAFEIIVTQYPDGRKVDDAMYSLGTVYDRLGNRQRAQELFQDVKRRFPNTSAANLADIYLRSLN